MARRRPCRCVQPRQPLLTPDQHEPIYVIKRTNPVVCNLHEKPDSANVADSKRLRKGCSANSSPIPKRELHDPIDVLPTRSPLRSVARVESKYELERRSC